MVPTIEELRAQCRIDTDEEDNLLTTYAKAARQRAENFINRPLFDDRVPGDVSEGLVITDDIKLAIMLAVGHWYENREGVALPGGFKMLLEPYRYIPL
ncbi:head-tail connector protein [Photorhabdus temperata]|uniref:head-tail connector protein n=1 Tax=Photorhabdus temperata TaxID=574560 RepID=UPI0021D4A2F1|nr:head-tail connector protein [Photorhabdus temperata]MCT8349487.1 head-tail connector protein [Photorhabdus temperata]